MRLTEIISALGARAATVPMSRLTDLRSDIDDILALPILNDFQRHIATKMYGLDAPETLPEGFVPRSLMMVAIPYRRARVEIEWDGKLCVTMTAPTYFDERHYPEHIESALNADGIHALNAGGIPHKLLAVRSGLCLYGRNNISYCGDWGSFIGLQAYATDEESDNQDWLPIRQMDRCKACRKCLDICPTKAIREDHYLIDNMRCVSSINEGPSDWAYPDWVPRQARKTLVDCSICQCACPANARVKDEPGLDIHITEDETRAILAGQPLDTVPAALREKLWRLGITYAYPALKRNLAEVLGIAD